MAFTDLLTQRSTIKRFVPTTTLMGEQTFTLTTIATNVLCEIQERGGGLNRRIFGELVEATHRGYYQAGTDLREKDKIIKADDGLEFEVIFVDKVFGNHHIEVSLRRPFLLAAS